MDAKYGSLRARLCLLLVGILLLSCELPVAIESGSPTSQLPTARPADTLPAAPPPPSSVAPPSPVAPPPTNTPLSALLDPMTTSLPTAAPEVSEVQIYLVVVGDSSSGKPVGCGDSLVPVTRQVSPTRQPIVAALNELFAIKEQFLGQSGLYNALYQSNLRVESAEIDANGIATVALTGQVMMGGECDTPRFKGQIEQTIRAVSGVQSANILLNGKTIDQALSLK